jgi:hypothetical protein
MDHSKFCQWRKWMNTCTAEIETRHPGLSRTVARAAAVAFMADHVADDQRAAFLAGALVALEFCGELQAAELVATPIYADTPPPVH